MAYFWLHIPFLIVPGIILVPKRVDGEPCLTKIFGSRGSNKVLVNHVISTPSVTSAAMCEIQCYIEITCESYNYGVTNNGSHVCELSDSDVIRDPLDLTTRQGFVYRGTENPCIIAKCPPNSRCYSDFENNTHSCVCLPRFIGENCGTEIIDCESSVISCHVNALCIRVKESLGCLCKEGFQGDGIICTDVDECSQGSHGCHLNALCVNTVGSYNCSCKLGFDGDGFNCRARKGFSPEKPAKTCAEVLNNTKNAPNGGYFLQLEDGNVQKTYCHMADIPGCGGGIWTLVMKINGSLLTFGYDSPYWSDQLSFNVNGGATGFDWEETKLPSYWSTPFTKLCLGMRVGESTRWIAVDYNASSLYSLLADGAYRPTSLGRNTWKSLIDDSSLQYFCDMEGFNAYPSEIDAVKARIGIIANDQNSCASCDSTIGFGTEVRFLEDTCGNDAAWSTDNGDRHTKAHCYILLQ